MAEYLTNSSKQTQTVDSLKNDCRSIGENIAGAIKDASKDFSVVADALAWFAAQLHRGEMNKADELYKELWGKMSDTTLCKKLWSETELTKWLSENTDAGKIKELCSKLSSGFECLKELEKDIKKLEPIMVVINSIYIISSDDSHKININSEKCDSASEIRSNMMSGVRKFDALMDIVNEINRLTPKGMREYIQYNVQVFKGSKQLFSIADRYAGLINELAKETKTAWDKALNNDNSLWNLMKGLGPNLDVNRLLDVINHYQRKKEKLKQQKSQDEYEIRRQE